MTDGPPSRDRPDERDESDEEDGSAEQSSSERRSRFKEMSSRVTGSGEDDPKTDGTSDEHPDRSGSTENSSPDPASTVPSTGDEDDSEASRSTEFGDDDATPDDIDSWEWGGDESMVEAPEGDSTTATDPATGSGSSDSGGTDRSESDETVHDTTSVGSGGAPEEARSEPDRDDGSRIWTTGSKRTEKSSKRSSDPTDSPSGDRSGTPKQGERSRTSQQDGRSGTPEKSDRSETSEPDEPELSESESTPSIDRSERDVDDDVGERNTTDRSTREEPTSTPRESPDDDFLRGGTATDESSSTATEDSGKRDRLWSESARDSSSTSDVDPSSGSSVDRSPTPDAGPEAFTEELDGSAEYARPAGLDLDPGTSVMIQCGSQDDRKHAACTDLLGLGAAGRDRNVLLVRYRKLHGSRLEMIAEAANQTKLISIGYSQQIPGSVRSEVETVEINNPNDITRLGILVSSTVKDWADADGETLVCYDSVNVLLEYKDVRSVFRFLHILLGTLDGADTVSHFHVDPLAGDSQDINTLKPLFDEVVSVDDVGVHRE